MKNVSPYLMFKGNCKEAITHYARCFKSEPRILPTEDGKGVMHASVLSGSLLIMASDCAEGEYDAGNNVQVYLDCESRSEVDELYKGLGEGGKSNMKPEKVFWGSYFASVTDKFGVTWMMGADEA